MMGLKKGNNFLVNDGKRIYDAKTRETIARNHCMTIFDGIDHDENNFDYDFIDRIETNILDKNELVSPLETSDLARLNPTALLRITKTEIEATIRQLKHKAHGPNGIAARQLKGLSDKMTLYLTDIFNHALTAGYFPDVYKTATMILIPKAGTFGATVKDRRPISLLNLDGKLLDKILNRRLVRFLDNNNQQNPTTTRFHTE